MKEETTTSTIKKVCTTCNGTGLSDGKGFSDTPFICPKCNGSGR